MTSSFDARAGALDAFLARTAFHDARHQPLGQDASTRRYIRLIRPDGTRAMLMDAPPVEPPPCPPDASDDERRVLGWNAMTRLAASRVKPFVLIADHLLSMGIQAPHVFAHDSDEGFALIEDFGIGREFARLIERGEENEVKLYRAAAATLAHLHSQPVPSAVEKNGEIWPILDFDRLALQANADLYADWLPAEIGGSALQGAARRRWQEERDALIEQALAFPRVLTLRDFHAENLLWLPAPRERVAVLDFQDAVRGWDAWDISMLTQDARRKVTPEAAEAVLSTYLDLTGKTRESLEERLAVIGTLNALRIAGVFSRLQHRDQKPRYGLFQPRQLWLLSQNLGHPALANMRAFVRETTPFVFDAVN
jgi:hypothetical protein